MQNIRAASFTRAKLGNIGNRILKITVLALITFVICRGPVIEGSFPAAIAFISYMVSRHPLNMLLMMPAAAGIVPYAFRGFDPWGDLAAVAVCGIFFAVSRHLKALPRQQAVMAAAITIVCISIYRLAAGTVYKMVVELLLFEGFLVFVMFFIFGEVCALAEGLGWLSEGGSAGSGDHAKGSAAFQVRGTFHAKGASLVSLTVFVLLVISGAGAEILMWPAIIMAGLWMTDCADLGEGLLAVLAGGVSAALLGQGQWGAVITVMMGLAAASAVKRYGAAAETGASAAVCCVLGMAESGVVLGVDHYSLFVGCGAFLAVKWKFGSVMKELASYVTGQKDGSDRASEREMKELLQVKIDEMHELSELYGTYMDSRSILADQFGITGQIMEDLRIRLGNGVRRDGEHIERLRIDIAISQCAASGLINGDCCGWQDIGNGRTAMVVSDGMGKGKKAAAESLMVTRTIISLLKSGVTAELTLKMINTIMLMKEDEDSYATVDLIIVDRKSGRTRFYKIGAAPTLIRRGSNVEEVKVPAVPLGIVNGLRIRYMETVLKKDDWIIMMSDGVSDGGSSRSTAETKAFLQQLKQAAAEVRSADPEIMSRMLIDRAADSYSGRERDDLTVLVARLC